MKRYVIAIIAMSTFVACGDQLEQVSDQQLEVVAPDSSSECLSYRSHLPSGQALFVSQTMYEYCGEIGESGKKCDGKTEYSRRFWLDSDRDTGISADDDGGADVVKRALAKCGELTLEHGVKRQGGLMCDRQCGFLGLFQCDMGKIRAQQGFGRVGHPSGIQVGANGNWICKKGNQDLSYVCKPC